MRHQVYPNHPFGDVAESTPARAHATVDLTRRITLDPLPEPPPASARYEVHQQPANITSPTATGGITQIDVEWKERPDVLVHLYGEGRLADR